MKTSSRNLSKRIVFYTLGAGAVTVAAAMAKHHQKGGKGQGTGQRGEILYSGPEEFSGDTIYFDLQNVVPPSDSYVSGDDFKLKSTTCAGPKKSASARIKGGGGYTPQVAAKTLPTGVYAYEFQAGQTIGLTGFYDRAYLQSYFEYEGEWHIGDRGFLGLKITIDCKDYYGWADVTLNTLECDEGPVFTLHDYAINTEEGESIKANEKKELKKHIHLYPTECTPTPSPTPSPTPTPTPTRVAALASLLISGASGVTRLKQRRESNTV